MIDIQYKYWAFYSNTNEIEWHQLEVVNSIPGERGITIITIFQ